MPALRQEPEDSTAPDPQTLQTQPIYIYTTPHTPKKKKLRKKNQVQLNQSPKLDRHQSA